MVATLELNSESNPSSSQVLSRRDGRGRFAKSGPRNADRIKTALQQRQFVRRKTTMKKIIFEKYLHAFFLEGSKDDSILAARSGGPIVEIYNAVIVRSWRLGKPSRYAYTRRYYLDAGHIRHGCGNGLGDFRDSLPRRPKVYKGCRLPIVSRRITEMSKVSEMLEFAEGKNALVVSVAESMEIVSKMIEEFRLKTNSTVSLPTTPSNPSIGDHVSQSSLCSDCMGSLCAGCQDHLSGGNGEQAAQPSNQHAMIGNAQGVAAPASSQEYSDPWRSANIENGTRQQHDLQASLSEEQRTRSRRLQCILNMAKVDEYYILLCMLFDASRVIEFGTYIREFRESLIGRNMQPPNLIKEVYHFSVSRNLRAIATEEHQEREKKLRSTMHLFEAARSSVGLPLYSNMTSSSTPRQPV